MGASLALDACALYADGTLYPWLVVRNAKLRTDGESRLDRVLFVPVRFQWHVFYFYGDNTL